MLHPSTLRHSRFDIVNAAIALPRVVIARVDDDYIIGHASEQVSGQVSNLRFRDRHHNHLTRPCRLSDRDGLGSGFPGEICERCRSSRVGNKHLMSEFDQPACQRAANLPSANDANIHVRTSRWTPLNRGQYHYWLRCENLGVRFASAVPYNPGMIQK